MITGERVDGVEPTAVQEANQPGQQDPHMLNGSIMGKWARWHTGLVTAIVAAIGLLGLYVPSIALLWRWLLLALLLVVFMAVAGHGVVGTWRGALIDERQRISLSRLQMVVWTILVLSGFLAAVYANIAAGVVNPLAIAVPEQLWLAMGIATSALVGAPVVKNSKATEPPANNPEVEKRIEATVTRLEGQGSTRSSSTPWASCCV